MAKKSKKPFNDYELAILARTYAARNSVNKTQAVFAELLEKGMGQDTYKQWEVRSLLPHEYILRFLELTNVDLLWFLEGRGKGPEWRPRFEELKAKHATPRKIKKAA